MTSSVGVVYALVSAASYGLMSFLVHWNPRQFPVEQMTFIRGLLTIAILLPFCFRELGKYFRPDAKFLWLRAVSGAFGLMLYYYTLQGTASANANLLFSGSPLFVVLLSWIFFRERLSAVEAIGVGLILVGNFLLYLPNRGAIDSWVWAAGVGGAFCASIAFLSLSAATKKYSIALIVIGLGVSSTLLSLAMPGKAWVPPLFLDWPFLIGVGLLGLLSQLTATLSFVPLKSSVAAALGRTSILFSGILDIAIGHYRPHALEWLSYFVVLGGVALAHANPQKMKLPRLK